MNLTPPPPQTIIIVVIIIQSRNIKITPYPQLLVTYQRAVYLLVLGYKG